MISILARFFSRWMIPLILLVSVWVSANLKWNEQFSKYTVTSDGKGYYAYLPAVFIYHDLNIGFFDTIEATYYDAHTKYDFRSGANGKVIDKYFCGVAVLQSPFFLCGHLAAKISGAAADGYSRPYMIFACIGAIFWLAIGLIFLKKFLMMHGASEGQAAFILAVIFFGTNLFYYALIEPLMSHVYSFAMVSMFLVYGKKWLGGNAKAGIVTALLLGMITLIRPVNMLAGFWLIYEAGGVLPLFKRKMELLKNFSYTATALFAFLFPLTIQLIIYKIQTGHFFIDAYGEEGFRFAHPEIFNFLFSYKKGLFVYLPISFVALFGLIPLWKKETFKAVFMLLFLSGIIYVLSSWWMWYYGGSFGTRVIVEYLPFFALLLYYLINGIQSAPLRISIIALLILLVIFCQLQTYQYRYEIIHWSEMTMEKYWAVFGVLRR